jgi:alpha-D-xyloside xylohydrolase
MDFWTGKSFEGGQQIDAPAPIDNLPLFVKAGSILPYGPAVQYANEKPDAPLELRVYPGADGMFTLYNDEGDNYHYESGAYSTIPIRWDEKAQTLTIGARQGKFPGMAAERVFRVVWGSEGKGAGIASTDKADMEVKYAGSEIRVTRANTP